MKPVKIILVALLLLLVSLLQLPAQLLFSDGFENYVGGGAPLDKNYGSGPNAAPNGSGNPWFGPAPPNARVVSAENGVTPHGGLQMIRGSAPSDFDQNWVNIAYRFNGGAPFSGNIALDWWFYDPLGAGGTTFRDYAALGFYNTAPATTDYPGTGSLNTGVSQIQRLSLGATYSTAAGFDANVYQARVVGAASDSYDGNGWFNTTVARTVGWHHGRIVLGAALGDGTANVSYYIDETLAFAHNSITSYGVNVIELNTSFGATTGYYDDIGLTVVPEPGAAALLLCVAGSWLVLRRKK